MQTRTKNALRKAMALFLTLALVIPMLMPLSVSADFEAFIFPGGPVLGAPRVIPAAYSMDYRNIRVEATGDFFVRPDVRGEGIENLENWVFGRQGLTPAGNLNYEFGNHLEAFDGELVSVEFISYTAVMLRFSGPALYVPDGITPRIYVIPHGDFMRSGVTPQPLLLYIAGEVDAPIGDNLFTPRVLVPTGWAGGGAGTYVVNPGGVPYGINPPNRIVVELTINRGQFTADAEYLENWYVDTLPLGTVDSASLDHADDDPEAPGMNLALAAVTRVDGPRGENTVARLEFVSYPEPNISIHQGPFDTLLNPVTAHRLFIRADQDAVTPVSPDVLRNVMWGNREGVPTDLPAIPMSLQIVDFQHGNALTIANPGTAPLTVPVLRAGWADLTEMAPGGSTGVYRTYTVLATLQNPDTFFTTEAADVDNWRLYWLDNSFDNTSLGRGIELINVDATQGSRQATLTLRAYAVTTSDLTSFADPLAGNDTLLIDGNHHFNVPNIYIRALYEAIDVASTVLPDFLRYHMHTHAYVPGGGFSLHASRIEILPSGVPMGDYPFSMTATASHPTFTGSTNIIGHTHPGLPANNTLRFPRTMNAAGATLVRVFETLTVDEEIQMTGATDTVAAYIPFNFDEGRVRLDRGGIDFHTRTLYLDIPEESGFRFGSIADVSDLNNWAISENRDPLTGVTGQGDRVLTGGAAGFEHEFELVTVNRVSDTRVRFTLRQIDGRTPSAIGDTVFRPFYALFYYNSGVVVSGPAASPVNLPAVLNEWAFAAIRIIPFIPPTVATPGAIPTGFGPAATAGLTVINVDFDDRAVFGGRYDYELFRSESNFRHDEPGTVYFDQFNWQTTTQFVHCAPAFCTRVDCAGPCIIPVGWNNAHVGYRYDRNVEPNLSVVPPPQASVRAAGLSLLRATRNADNRGVNLVFDGEVAREMNALTAHTSTIVANAVMADLVLLGTAGVDYVIPATVAESPWLFIRATSVHSNLILEGGRALDYAHRHTREARVLIGEGPAEVGMAVVDLNWDAANGVSGIFGPFLGPQMFDHTNFPITDFLPVLATGLPRNQDLNARIITVELENGTFAAAATNINNWSLDYHTNQLVGGDDPDISISHTEGNTGVLGGVGRAPDNHPVYGLQIVAAFPVAGNPGQFNITVVGDAQIHANAVMAITIDGIAIGDGTGSSQSALLRVGADQRPWLHATNAQNVVVGHVSPAAGGNTTVRVFVNNSWFTRYALETADWSARVITAAQAADHQDHEPGATGTMLTDNNVGTALVVQNVVLVGSDDYDGHQDQLGHFNAVDITITGALPAGDFLAIRPVAIPYIGGWFTGDIQIRPFSAGTEPFYATGMDGTTIPFAVEYLLLNIGAPVVVPTVTDVEVTPNRYNMTIEQLVNTTLQFNSTVVGANNPPQTVIWSLGELHDAINISTTGLLTVGITSAVENGYVIRVYARSTFNNAAYGYAIVNIVHADVDCNYCQGVGCPVCIDGQPGPGPGPDYCDCGNFPYGSDECEYYVPTPDYCDCGNFPFGSDECEYYVPSLYPDCSVCYDSGCPVCNPVPPANGTWGWDNFFYFQVNGVRQIGLVNVGNQGTEQFEGDTDFDGWHIFNEEGFHIWNLTGGTQAPSGWALMPFAVPQLVYYEVGVGPVVGVRYTSEFAGYHSFGADHILIAPFSRECHMTEGEVNGINVDAFWNVFYLLPDGSLLRNASMNVRNPWTANDVVEMVYATADSNGVLSF